MFQFEFIGGADKETGDKFLLFLVIGGQEEIIYQAASMGLIQQQSNSKDPRCFQTAHQIVKIFTLTNVHETRIVQNFYFEMINDEGANKVEIKPLHNNNDYYFRSRGRFLKRKEILEILSDDNPSRPFVERQRILPKETLKRMITIERPKLVFGGRRVGRRKE